MKETTEKIMKKKLKFKLDAIPERFGGGYKAKIGNVLSVAAGPAAKCNRLVFGCDLSIVGRNLGRKNWHCP